MKRTPLLAAASAAAAVVPSAGATPPPAPAGVWLAAWMVTAVFSLSNTATPLYGIWQGEMGFGAGTLTLIFTAYILGLLTALTIAGQLSDRLGRRPVLLPGLLAALLACILFAGATSVLVLGIARFLTGVAVGIIVSAGMAAVVDVGGEAHKRTASLAASVAQVLGAGLGPLLAGALAQWMAKPVPGVYLIEGGLLASALVAMWTLPLGRGAQSADRRLHLPSVPAANRAQFMRGLSIYAPGLAATTFVAALGPSLLARLLHVHSPLIAGATVALMFFSATGVQFVVRRLSVRPILSLAAAAIVFGMALMAVAVHTALAAVLILAAIFAGVGQGLGQLGALTLIAGQVAAARRAEANSVLNIGAYVVAGLFAVSTGFLIDAIGFAPAAYSFAALLALMGLAGGWLVRSRTDMAA